MSGKEAKKPQKPANDGDKGKHAGGRPTLYLEEYATEEHVQEFVKHCEEKEKVVTICGYAVYVNIVEETLLLWKKAHPEFISTVERIKQISKSQLFQGGLDKTLSSRIVKLGLSANHGMNEKSEHEHSGGINVIINN